MAINIEQVKRRQPAMPQCRRPNRILSKYHLILKVLLLAVIGILIVTAAVIYGNHTQWQTASTVQKASHQARRKTKKQRVFKANNIKQIAAKKNVTLDYSGTGGLSNKADMLKLAQSNQTEILRGFVAVPSFNISEPIYEGTSNHVLAIGAGINAPNIKFGNGLVPIFAHNMGDYNALWPYHPTKFSALQNMTEKTVLGKDIYLSDGQTVYRYKTTHLEYGIQVDDMNQELTVGNTGKPKVKLIACLEDQDFWQQVKASHYTNYQANKRIVLTGDLVSQASFNSLDAKLKEQLQ
ncbi:Sortase (surface protein transpeptidase) [Leuconostoc inhae]|uniref:Sortase (Surface protein transpeptidase) n=2 Tax=Leuconostoc TaxID=1243 RepID=A0AAN2QW91_9LACO|nr:MULTISPECIES: sortase [Leuconostoc]MBZ5958931.1 class A sortase [Leuconostoc gasicomitatum]MBZ5982094.1 class A sortase [Leuconostoc gasicomitatum]MBZ5989044.1 class A sortase [Leuconostoc gasicomitatum]MBZ5989816.1 class A sortase [Leuconostoc gasicomitatum]CUR63630.1 Sortase 3 SrtA3 [Leuconostoc gasicomitatum KG16-1]